MQNSFNILLIIDYFYLKLLSLDFWSIFLESKYSKKKIFISQIRTWYGGIRLKKKVFGNIQKQSWKSSWI